MGRLFLSGVVLIGLQCLLLSAIPPYQITKLDYLASAPLTTSSIWPSSYPSVEQQTGQATVPCVSWTKGGTKQVAITFKNPSAAPHSVGVVTDDGWFHDPTTSSLIGVSVSPSTLSFGAYGEATVTYTLTGIPDYVAKGTLEVPIEFTNAVSGYPTGFGTTIYLTQSSPTGLQSTVWTDVLEEACEWALGLNSEAGCRQETTIALFRSGIFKYQHHQAYYTVRDLSHDGEEYAVYFLLKSLCEDMQESVLLLADCRDVSNYLLTVWSALGVSGSGLRLKDDNDNQRFWTNKICPAGYNWLNLNNYVSYLFDYHQVASSGGNVFDPCAAHWTNLSGGAYKNPPTGWSVAGYWQTPDPLPIPGLSAYFGLVNRYENYSNPEGQPVGYTSQGVLIKGYQVP